MNRSLLALAVLPTGRKGGVEIGETDTDVPSCTTTITTTLPADSSNDAYYRGAIEFHLTAPDMTAQVITDIPGTQSFRQDGAIVVWSPSSPLEPEANYSATLEYCGGSPEIHFRTSELGTELIPENADFQDRTYSIDMNSGRFVEGEGIAEVAATLFTQPLLLGVAAIDPDFVTMRMALSDGKTPAGQDYCARTKNLPPATLEDSPFIVIGGQDIELDYKDQGSFTLKDLSFEGTLAPDGTYVGGAAFSVTIDATQVTDAFDFADVAALCDFAATLGTACETCPDSSSETCITIAADHINSGLVDGLVIDEITEADTDSRCAL